MKDPWGEGDRIEFTMGFARKALDAVKIGV